VPSPIETAPRHEEQARHEEPRHEEPRREETRQEEPRHEEPRRAEPRIDPKPILEDAGLVMVETDRSKAKVVPEMEEPAHVGRPRSERPKPPAPESDELVQIETKR